MQTALRVRWWEHPEGRITSDGVQSLLGHAPQNGDNLVTARTSPHVRIRHEPGAALWTVGEDFESHERVLPSYVLCLFVTRYKLLQPNLVKALGLLQPLHPTDRGAESFEAVQLGDQTQGDLHHQQRPQARALHNDGRW